MGSFNIRCAITNLSILDGDEVVIVPIIQSPPEKVELKSGVEVEIGNQGYSFLFPFKIHPILGKYADYGLFTLNLDNEESLNSIKLLFDELLKMKLPVNERESIDWDAIQVAVDKGEYKTAWELLTNERGTILLDYCNILRERYITLVKFFVIHKAVVDYLIQLEGNIKLNNSDDYEDKWLCDALSIDEENNWERTSYYAKRIKYLITHFDIRLMPYSYGGQSLYMSNHLRNIVHRISLDLNFHYSRYEGIEFNPNSQNVGYSLIDKATNLPVYETDKAQELIQKIYDSDCSNKQFELREVYSYDLDFKEI